MQLTNKQRRELRTLAHTRKPVVTIGAAGFTEQVGTEIDAALEQHELIKLRINAQDRASRDRIIQSVCERTGAILIQRIGHIAVLYRRHSKKPRILLQGNPD